MKQIICALVWTIPVLAMGSAIAGKVNIPKEGTYEFEFCVLGSGKTFSSGDKLFVISYLGDANLKSTPPGRAFDRMGSRCYGIYSNINGRQQETGICELTDLDGDK